MGSMAAGGPAHNADITSKGCSWTWGWREGAHVAICARKAGEVDEAVAAWRAKGVQAFDAVVDIADAAQLTAWIVSAVGQLGGLDRPSPPAST